VTSYDTQGPEIVLGQCNFEVNCTESELVSSHWFASDYDEECWPCGQSLRAVVTVAQDMLLLEIKSPQGQTLTDCWLSLSSFYKSGSDAILCRGRDEFTTASTEKHIPQPGDDVF
jgi:hypothetical protein